MPDTPDVDPDGDEIETIIAEGLHIGECHTLTDQGVADWRLVRIEWVDAGGDHGTLDVLMEKAAFAELAERIQARIAEETSGG